MTKDSRRRTTIILETALEVFDVSIESLESKSRKQPLCLFRQNIMATIYRFTDLDLTAIGDLFGNRHHTTVHHALKASSKNPTKSPTIPQKISTFKNEVTLRINTLKK